MIAMLYAPTLAGPAGSLPQSQEQEGAPTPDLLRELRDRLEGAEERIRVLEERASPLGGDGGDGGEAESTAPRHWLHSDVLGGRASLGGYIDLEARDEHGSTPTFRVHRFVPQIDARIGRLHVAAEIEFEDGGSDGSNGEGETKIEFAVVDWQFGGAFTLRGGALLVPLGRFNLNHDSPLNDFTDRPLVAVTVIPTTLTDAGIGGLGEFEVGEEGSVGYEVYVVNGFEGLVADPTTATGLRSEFDTSSGLRNGRPSLKADGSSGLSAVGRVDYSPRLGIEFGVSAEHGPYDVDGDLDLWIAAFDLEIAGGAVASFLEGFELLGEIARSDLERDAVARASGVPDDLWGFVVEANRHFMPESFRRALPSVFTPDSTLTAAVRFDHAELGSERTQRLTFGLNFRPIEETVFKFDLQFNYEDGSHGRVDNDAILFSIATYF